MRSSLRPTSSYFRRKLDEAAVLVHGRNSGEGGPDAALRRRLYSGAARRGPEPDPHDSRAMLWNPAAATLEQAWDALGLSGGLLAVIGGTAPFGLFLDRYDAFHLSRAKHARFPGGVPVFPGIPPPTPEDLLAQHGLKPDAVQDLDPSAGSLPDGLPAVIIHRGSRAVDISIGPEIT